jgi:uncharacterized protein with NRDE domain
MCTVTVIPYNKGFILTSSRDENPFRETIPLTVGDKDETLLFPKDKKGGGTWIVASPTGYSACLLNGAFENHDRKPPYKLSRGKILLDSMKSEDPETYINNYNLEDIEPFTIVLISRRGNYLKEFRWDGNAKYNLKLDSEKSYIWSSATLYDLSAREQRRSAFERWMLKGTASPEGIFKFHNSRHLEEEENDVLMYRNKYLKTISISQVVMANETNYFRYTDLVKNENIIVDYYHDW